MSICVCSYHIPFLFTEPARKMSPSILLRSRTTSNWAARGPLLPYSRKKKVCVTMYIYIDTE